MTLDRNTLLEAAKVCAEQFERDLPNQKSGGQSQDYSDGYLYGTYDCARAIRALAAAQPDTVCVPREPTPEMIQVMEDRMVEGASYIAENSIQYALWKEVYRAMLAASGGKS